MGSSRFPGKMMQLINGKPVIDWVLQRTCGARKLTKVILATTDKSIDDPLVYSAEKFGVSVFRGSEEDVLGRFKAAVKNVTCDIIVRICGDRPLVDPNLIDEAIEFYRLSHCDLCFNHISEKKEYWPRGFGVEVFSTDLLYWLDENAHGPDHREHVTLYLWENRHKFKIIPLSCPNSINLGIPDIRFDLDWPEDLQRIRLICEHGDIHDSVHEMIGRYRNFMSWV